MKNQNEYEKRCKAIQLYKEGHGFNKIGSSPYRVGKRDMKVKTFLLHLATTPALEVSNLYCQIDTRVATR